MFHRDENVKLWLVSHKSLDTCTQATHTHTCPDCVIPHILNGEANCIISNHSASSSLHSKGYVIVVEVEGDKRSHEVKLFVFGDSYVDTGNSVNSASYKPPSGDTFPGKPAGRFSDGCVLTDYIASYLKIKSPTPYIFRNSSELQYGMNFAHGGSGIFNTSVDGPNMTVQIDSFENLIKEKVYTKADLESSVALVNAAGNDYATFLLRQHGSIQDMPVFTTILIRQMSLNLRRIHSLGINKIAVGLLEPIGCMPLLTVASSYEKCLEPFNLISQNHSQMLLQIVQELNKELGKPVFVTLDLYNSFLSVISTMQKRHSENPTLMNPLQPCCEGVSMEYSCGSVDEKGEKKYCLCKKPELSFFWEGVHLSQNGWYAVYMMLYSSLSKL
ncbi:GDSL esterase/lipase isoform B [Glycine soja]|uniref:GDSL esterase/lipase isoform B n=2 Tax=Glycine soja TaxID=3848 RepID=A0A445IQ90_GLYSO|nr:GDSL esterase/lipase isoform B [Glycine soja]